MYVQRWCTNFDGTDHLKQIGGGYEEHDLAELSLFWMAVRDMNTSWGETWFIV